jgi:PASTA domain-containing protein
MSDERDETRRFSPFDDESRAGGRPTDETRAGGPPTDETLIGPRVDDRTKGSDATAFLPPTDDWSAAGRAGDRAPNRSDDWAANRSNAAWSGRAAVRSPQPEAYPPGPPAGGEWPARGPRAPRDRWWLPVVVGILALFLLAALGWIIYLVAQNSSDDPAPARSAITTGAPTGTDSTKPTTSPPTTKPTTTTPTTTTTPPTTDPTVDEVTVPALRGLTLPEAQAALSRMGLHYRLRFQTSDAAPGTVIDSDPAEGQEVPPDTRITLVVAAQSTTGVATTNTVTAGE